MKKLSNYIGSEFKIFQKSIWKREFELRSGDEIIAQMIYPRFFSHMAELTIQNESYEFYRSKFFTRNVDVRKKDYQNPFAYYKSNLFMRSGKLELPKGTNLNIKFGLFRKQAEVYLGENDLLISILNKFSFKERSKVVIEKRSEIIDEYPWILMFVFYLVQLRKRRSGARS
jgi:hypothetical protein